LQFAHQHRLPNQSIQDQSQKHQDYKVKFLEGGALLGIGIYSGAKAINYYYEIENKSDNLRESWFSTQEIKKDVKVLFGITLAYIMFKKAADILGVK
jgi:hypothetical protein